MKRHLLTSTIIIILLLLTFAPSRVFARENWTSVRSKNFTVVGNASESDLRKMATKLELFRYVISLYLPGAKISTPVPTTIVFFKDDYSFDPFKPLYKGKTKKNIAGYFRSGDDMNYIVLSKEVGASNALQVILHEYEHFVVHNSVTNAPPWLDEGLAEFYSTFEQQGDLTVRIGIPIDWHLSTLRSRDILPLRTLLNVNRQSSYYNENDKASIFYAESWALVHYLMRSDGGKRRPQLTRFISQLNSGLSPEENFEQAFQTDLKMMEKELRAYISRFLVPAVDLDFKSLEFAKEMQVAPLSEAEAHFYMGDLQARGNRLKEAEEHLEKSLALDARQAQSKVALAVVRARQNRLDEYKRLLQEAMQTDAKYYLAHFYYGDAMMQERRYEEAIKYYKQAALLKPDAWRIQVGLAQAYLGLGQESEASKAFSAALRLNPQNSSINRAYSYAALGMARGSLAAINAKVYLQREGWRDEHALYMAMVAHYGHRLAQRADDATQVIEEAAEKGDTSSWPYPVIEYLRHKRTEAELLALANDNDKQTEAHAYIGMDLSLKGERDAALVHLRWVRENGNRSFVEYPLALSEINRLEAQSSSSSGAQ